MWTYIWNWPHLSGVTMGVGARGQGILTEPRKFCLVVKKTDDLLFSRQILPHHNLAAPFRNCLQNYHWNLILRRLCRPFDPQNISKYIPVSSFCAPFFTCARGRPPSSAPPRYATSQASPSIGVLLNLTPPFRDEVINGWPFTKETSRSSQRDITVASTVYKYMTASMTTCSMLTRASVIVRRAASLTNGLLLVGGIILCRGRCHPCRRSKSSMQLGLGRSPKIFWGGG